jgi:putative transposase
VINNFLLEQKLKDEEIERLEFFVKSNPEARELKRALSIKMAIQGHPHNFISQLLGVSKFFVSHWKKVFKVNGIEGIKLGYKGSRKYLTVEQIEETKEWLSSREYWHLDELVNYVFIEYGVTYKSKQSYYDIFKSANISWKRTQKSNPKFNEELVKKKTEEINDVLAKNQAEIESGRTVVLFLDECHLLHGDICGYIWGKTKIRIEIPIENEKNRQTYFGALNYQNQEFTIESYPSGNGESTIKFIKHLQNKYEGSKIILIWDGASYHRFGEFRDFLEKVNHGIPSSDWSITCILFAPNAPEQNPVEDVWLQAKNFLRKYWHLCRSFKAIKILFELFTSEQKFDFPKVHLYQPTEQLI